MAAITVCEQDVGLHAVSGWVPLQAFASQRQTTALVSMPHLSPPATTTAMHVHFPRHHDGLFHGPRSDCLGKEVGRRKTAIFKDCTVNSGLQVSSWRNKGLVIEIWFSYICSGRQSWRKALGIDVKSSLTL